MNAMKKMIGLAALGLALVLSGCSKTEMEGAELSKKMAGTGQAVPVPNLEPDSPQQKKDGGK